MKVSVSYAAKLFDLVSFFHVFRNNIKNTGNCNEIVYVSCRMRPLKCSVAMVASIMKSLLAKENFLTPGLFLLGRSPDLPITSISVNPK